MLARIISGAVVVLATAGVAAAGSPSFWEEQPHAFREDVARSGTYGWWAGEEPDPGAELELRISGIADRGLDGDTAEALDPCRHRSSESGRRMYCWSSYGRRMQLIIPDLVWDVAYTLRPRTLYSRGPVDVRFPPQMHVTLPFEGSLNFGYDRDVAGMRLRFRF